MRFPSVSKLILSQLCGTMGLLADQYEATNWTSKAFVIIYLVRYPHIFLMDKYKMCLN